MTTQEAVQQLTDLKTQVDKVRTEVQALKDALETHGDDIPQELADAINNVVSAVQSVDDINPDTSTEPPPTT